MSGRAIAGPLREQLTSGFRVPLELRSAGAIVGACSIVYDLWDEDYAVTTTASAPTRIKDPTAAVATCLDRKAFASGASNEVDVVEVLPPPGPTPGVPRPIF